MFGRLKAGTLLRVEHVGQCLVQGLRTKGHMGKVPNTLLRLVQDAGASRGEETWPSRARGSSGPASLVS
jgi:hypothetical protein